MRSIKSRICWYMRGTLLEHSRAVRLLIAIVSLLVSKHVSKNLHSYGFPQIATQHVGGCGHISADGTSI